MISLDTRPALSSSTGLPSHCNSQVAPKESEERPSMHSAEREAGPAGGKGTRSLFWVVLVEISLYVLLDAVAQSLPPHYSPIRDAESALAVGPYGYIMTVNFVNRGVLSFVFLYALLRVTSPLEDGGAAGTRRRPLKGSYLFGAWGLGAVFLAVFPTDVPATPVSPHGAVHIAVAVLAFIAGAIGELRLSLQFGDYDALRGAARHSLALAVLSVGLLLLYLGLPFLAPHFSSRVGGLTERLFLGTVLLWIAIVSAHLARGPSGARGRPTPGRKH